MTIALHWRSHVDAPSVDRQMWRIVLREAIHSSYNGWVGAASIKISQRSTAIAFHLLLQAINLPLGVRRFERSPEASVLLEAGKMIARARVVEAEKRIILLG